jgi:hypothetical protein
MMEQRIIEYAERYFQRSGMTEFPTVRQVARACRCSHADVEAAVDSSGAACLDGVNVEGWKLGDLEVYVTNPPRPVPHTEG